VQNGGALNVGTNFTNQTGGTLTVQTSGTLSTTGSFANQTGATVNVLSAGTINDNNGGSFTNQGTLNVNLGNVKVLGGQFVNSGTANITSGGSVVSAGLNNTGGTINLTNAGTLNTILGTFSNLDGSGNLTGGAYNLSGGSLMSYGGSGTFVNIGAGTELTLSDTALLVNASSANALGTLASNAGSLTIQAGYNISTPGAFANSGALSVGNLSTFHTAGNFTDTGMVNVGPGGAVTIGGNLTETAGLTQVDNTLSATNIQIQGGTLKGTGTITGNVSNTGTGIIAPGDSPGILNITGAYTQAGADLLIQITGNTAGSGYSELNVSGLATLNGEIEFDFISFVPDSTMYHVLLYGSHSGAFTSTVIDNLSGYSALLNYTPTELDVTFSQSGVPEPSTLGMALVGLLAAWIGFRRRQFKYKNSLVDIRM
jgi:fibronectin-binding autotransporter adhesin